MKIIILLASLVFSATLFAGENPQVPANLLNIDNQGRLIFIDNVRKQLSLSKSEFKYINLNSIILSGDQDPSNNSWAMFLYKTEIKIIANDTRFKCSQVIEIDELNPRRNHTIICEKINN